MRNGEEGGIGRGGNGWGGERRGNEQWERREE